MACAVQYHGLGLLARRVTLGWLVVWCTEATTNRQFLVLHMWGIKPFSCWIYLLNTRVVCQITHFLFFVRNGGGTVEASKGK